MASTLASNTQRVRVESWAKPGEAEPAYSALGRGNAMRDTLIARGVAAERIEVVAHPEVASGNNHVKLVAIQDPRPAQAVDADRGDSDEPRGVARFMTKTPVTIDAGHSAMISLFERSTSGERVFLYDPVSERGSKRFAFNAVRIVNPTQNTLESGPMKVYAKGQFLGEGLAEPIPPGASAIVPYALDRSSGCCRSRAPWPCDSATTASCWHA